nr:helix-turn-helix transcriptional regulator [Kineococcus siccus]
MVVLRRTIGDVLRDERRGQQRTLREVSSTARVSLGYLSEVERGQKEASSELLASICSALEVPLSRVMGEVTRRIAHEEGVRRPYAAEGLIAPPAAVPVPALVPLPQTELDETEAPAAGETSGDAAAAVDSAVAGLSAEEHREFSVELDGLPDELELILRRRLVPAA